MHIAAVKRFNIIHRETQVSTHNNSPSRASYYKYPLHLVTASPTMDVSYMFGRPHGLPAQNASRHGSVPPWAKGGQAPLSDGPKRFVLEKATFRSKKG
jgi:hypothetical protein